MAALETHLVTAADSPEFALLVWALRHSSVVGLDAEWKPYRTNPRQNALATGTGSGGGADVGPDSSPRSFPVVTLLQIACRVRREPSGPEVGDSPVFLVDLLAVPFVALWEPLREMFVSPAVIKLGFHFKQDLVYLSSTFSSHGLDAGFDEVEPFLDITNIYYHLNNQMVGKNHVKDTKSLSTICKEVLNVSLSKDLQCSDWSCRPLSEEQIYYAAADAYYLLEIFRVFQQNICSEGKLQPWSAEKNSSLADGLESPQSNDFDNVVKIVSCEASQICTSASTFHLSSNSAATSASSDLDGRNLSFDECFSHIATKYVEKILLKESDKRPRPSRRKVRQSSATAKIKEHSTCDEVWEGPPAWELSIGGDGCPKFLCDVMVEGLAKHLRCVGIDAAIPTSRKPDSRQLLDQAYKEKRVLLTRDAKLLKQQYFRNQVYRVKSLLKNEQLLEVIETFQLKISEEQLMSRCTKCNGSFIQKPLTTEEAIAASKGFQVIPQCLFNRNLEFWQCIDCKQLYWEGTQYHNAVQKFVEVCKLSD